MTSGVSPIKLAVVASPLRDSGRHDRGKNPVSGQRKGLRGKAPGGKMLCPISASSSERLTAACPALPFP